MLDRTQTSWHPPYKDIYLWRNERLIELQNERWRIEAYKKAYAKSPLMFIEHWGTTYDPRNAGTVRPARMPFYMFPKQREFIQFLHELVVAQECGLVEKSRDMGATWLCCAFSVWLWLFWPGASVGWGSRKEMLVDNIGDPDSIFEKMRMFIGALPVDFLPKGFNPSSHMTSMKIVNPENDATIRGESGDNIGRGGRKLIYFKDESAHYERPEMIENALMDNTRCQIDISSVNGLNNVFHNKRKAGADYDPSRGIVRGKTNVFVMRWQDHPEKDLAWYQAKRRKAEEEGLLAGFAQEVDRNYAASLEGIIIPQEWVLAAFDAHKKLKSLDWTGGKHAALDVADEGGDRNAYAARTGVVLDQLLEWGEGDTGATARKAADLARSRAPLKVEYDCVGVGAGVKAETNRLIDEGIMPRGVRFLPWNGGLAPLYPDDNVEGKDTPTNKEFYYNLKAQGWWQLRRRFEKTHRMITGKGKYTVDEMVSIDTEALGRTTTAKLQEELSQPTYGKSPTLKLIINKKPPGTRSPNLADAVMMCYWPADRTSYDSTFSWVR